MAGAHDRTVYENLPGEVENLLRAQLPYPLDTVIRSPKVTANKNIEIAAVKRFDENTIMVNPEKGPDGYFSGLKQVMPHELEHLLQNKVVNRHGASYSNQVIDELQKHIKDDARKRIVSALTHSMSSPVLFKHLQDKGYTPSDYLGKSSKGDFDLREQFADLSALEQAYHIDLTQDPVVRKEFFRDDEDLIKIYKATTGLRMDRLDAKDLPPMTISKPKTSLADEIKRKANEALPAWISNVFGGKK